MDATFEDFLAKHIVGDETITDAECHLLITPKAKRVRPNFVFACGRLLGVTEKELFESAAGVELMHTGSLLHDDIIDEADERRNRPSVNKLYGNSMAILAGDSLLSRAMLSFSGVKNGAKATQQAAKTFIELTEAMAVESKLGLTEVAAAELIKIADGKTGALFGLCGYLAGLAAKDAEAAEHLNQAGRLAGRAFQFRDDIDDLEEDAANGVPTLPQLVSSQEVERATEEALLACVEQLKPYEGRPGHAELITTIYTLARTPMLARAV